MDAITLALIKALGGGGGGSGLPPTGPASVGDVLSLDNNKKPQWVAPSGGGGVLTVHETVSGGTHTLDKTWQQIHDADLPVVILDNPDGGGTIRSWTTYITASDDGNYIVSVDGTEYSSGTASGYPSYTE